MTLAGLVGLVSCTDSSAESLDAEERARAAEIGSEVANALAGTLIGRLSAALEEGGPAHAVDFCSEQALSLTDSLGQHIPGRVTVGRTSLRVRNPANAPDDLDRRVLEAFDEAVRSGGPLPSEDVRVSPAGDVRYYRPLVVNDLCLGCHGPVEDLDPEVRELLRVRYPGDAAVGYEVGDVRGAIRVRIPRSEVRPR